MTTRVYFKRDFPAQPAPTQYYAGQIVDLDDALANTIIAEYFGEVYNSVNDYPQPYEWIGSTSTDMKVGMPDGKTVGLGQKLDQPTGFNFPTSYNIDIFQNGLDYSSNADVRMFVDPACWTGLFYMVDPINGNDANTGQDSYDGWFRPTTSVKTIGRAIQLGNASGAAYRVILRGGQTYALADILQGGTTVVMPTQSIVLMSAGKGKAIVSTHQDTTWTPFGTQTGNDFTYSTQPSLSSVTNPVGRGVDMANTDLWGDWVDYTNVTSVANCQATPQSIFIDNTTTPNTVYVNRADKAPVTSENTRIWIRQDAIGISNVTYTRRYFVDGIEFQGGRLGAFTFIPSVPNINAMLLMTNVSAKYSQGNGANGYTVNSCGFSFFQDWHASANATDGCNVKDLTGIGGVSISINGEAYSNGRTPNSSCNGYTTHDGVLSIDLNSSHYQNGGGNGAHVSTSSQPTRKSRHWSIGCYYGPSRGNPTAAVGLSGSSGLQYAFWNSSALCWLEGCKFESRTAAIYTDNTQVATLLAETYVRNCMINGTITTTVGNQFLIY